MMGKERVSYTTAEKLKIIKYAETNANRAAGREFKVNEANIRQWRLKKDRLQQLPKKKMAERPSTHRWKNSSTPGSRTCGSRGLAYPWQK